MSPKSLRLVLAVLALVAGGLLATNAPASAANPGDPVNVYRFWSSRFANAHFYTASFAEASNIRDTDANWSYEGVAFQAKAASTSTTSPCPTGTPVFRFFSSKFASHFYTADSIEADKIRTTDSNWSYEGVTYCAFKTQTAGTVALHRFWSPVFGKHFYTANQSEADHIRASDRNWDYENVAYYVEPISHLYPSEVLNLARWRETLPIDSNGGTTGTAISIDQPELATYEHPDWFHAAPGGNGVVFRANTGGARTSTNTAYPRSELREMKDATGTSQAKWFGTSGTHIMTVTEAITHTPDVKPDVVAAQIHDSNDDIIEILLQGSTLWAWRNGRTESQVLDGNYQLGTKFSVRIQSDPSGIQVTYWKSAGASTPTTSARFDGLTTSSTGWYFKAGCYPQSNTSTELGNPDAYGEVIIYGLTVEHH